VRWNRKWFFCCSLAVVLEGDHPSSNRSNISQNVHHFQKYRQYDIQFIYYILHSFNQLIVVYYRHDKMHTNNIIKWKSSFLLLRQQLVNARSAKLFIHPHRCLLLPHLLGLIWHSPTTVVPDHKVELPEVELIQLHEVDKEGEVRIGCRTVGMLMPRWTGLMGYLDITPPYQYCCYWNSTSVPPRECQSHQIRSTLPHGPHQTSILAAVDELRDRWNNVYVLADLTWTPWATYTYKYTHRSVYQRITQ